MNTAHFLATTLLSVGSTLLVHAADTSASRRTLTPDDFYNTQTVTEPRVSPDGKWVAYVVSTNDRDADESRSAIWMVSWDGTQQVPLTNPTHDISSPRWSQDGRYLSYMATPTGTDKSQIMLLDRRGGEARALTTVTDDILSYEWSPDSKHLVLVMEQAIPKSNSGGTGSGALKPITPEPSAHEPSVPRPSTPEPSTPERSTPHQSTPKPGPAASKPLSNSPDSGKDSAPSESKDPGKKAAEIPKPIVIDSKHFKEDKEGYLGSGHNRHLYLLDVDGRKIEPLTADPAFNEDLPAWSADSRRVAFVRTHEKGSDADGMEDIDLIDAQPVPQPAQSTPAAQPSSRAAQLSPSAAQPTPSAVQPTPAAAQPSPPAAQLTPPARLLRVYTPNQQKLSWYPDGSALAFLQGAEPKYGQYIQDRLAVVKTTGGTSSSLSDSLDRGISSYAINKDGASITVTLDDDGTAYPAIINTRSRSIKKLPQGASVVSDLSTAGGHTAVLSSNDTSPTEVYALEGEHLRRLTRHNDAFVAGLQLGAVEDIRFNSADGTPIHGLVVKPPGFQPGRKYPTVLWIHGGPNLQDEHSLAFDGYQFKRQLLAAGGFVVFGVNYRGSSGKGDAFSRAILADWGHKEVEDLMAGIDYLVQQGMADPAKLGIGGWSYGGMLTDYTIATNTRFKAALSGAGTGNPLGLYAADQYYIQYDQELGDPWRNTDLYIKLAYPLLHAERIRTPTLFMGGDKDFNVPIAGGEQMYLALRTLDVPAQLIVYPGEYHSLTRPSFLKDRAERMAAWFGQYLLSSTR